jgi:SAM-dependent methyltransferase
MAHYYRALVKDRNHFQNQTAVVKRLVKYLSNPCHRILDAACGTGDVLALLASEYKHIAGVDGSPEMLTIAISDARLEGIPLSYCKWEHLPSFFMRQGQFDLIFLLGNSIAHVEDKAHFEHVVSIIHDGLTLGGIIAFDTRDWNLDEQSGNLVEPGRPVNCPRILGTFDVEGEIVEITDLCSYSDNRQYIKYKVQGDNWSDTFTLSYLPFSRNDALGVLTQSGFVDCKINRYPDWNYLVIVGFRL